MSSEQLPPRGHRVSTTRAVRYHLAVVMASLVLGGLAGVLYAASSPTAYTSTARVLVNPSVGNPFAPTPTAVRQDELTSLETEAQVARSAEVLASVAADQSPAMTTTALERGLQIVVPPNTQILQISYTAADPAVAQRVTAAVARTYLANRAQRFDEVNTARIDRLQTQTDGVVNDLRDATAAAQTGSAADRLFQSQLATALRNELVSLRAQRTALETSDSPAGAVIAPASTAQSATDLVAAVAPVGGALVGLGVGCLIALLLERARGVVRSQVEVEESGLPVAAAVPSPGWRTRLLRRHDPRALDGTIRRLRASILELDPRPDVLTVAPAGAGESDAEITEAVAESLARGGHRVVLVRTDRRVPASELVKEEGLGDVLLHERLDVLELLQPSVEPLLCILAGGFNAKSRELLIADRVRAVLAPLIEAGNLVVIQSPGIDNPEGEALAGAADLGLVIVRKDRTRLSALDQVRERVGAGRTPIATLVIGRRDAAHRSPLADDDDVDSDSRQVDVVVRSHLFRAPQ
jgi:succinoglycan biosynthesis transport protein ExoP